MNGVLMKSTGVVRKIDELGRIVLPVEIRKVFGIHEGDQLDISVNGEQIILEKRRDLCLFCGASDPRVDYQGRRVCDKCAGELGQLSQIDVRLPADTVRLPEETKASARR
jgi:AbrB family transcriptional regulator, transcriptional pleiotropic regulator of transition state genes